MGIAKSSGKIVLAEEDEGLSRTKRYCNSDLSTSSVR